MKPANPPEIPVVTRPPVPKAGSNLPSGLTLATPGTPILCPGDDGLAVALQGNGAGAFM
jgi:hypothetical protein